MSALQHIKITDYTTLSDVICNLNLSYQTFGQPLGEAPIVLVIHALTGNSNVCGKTGWWNNLIGDDKCIDTNQYTILAFNIPGNGYDGFVIDNYKDFIAADIARIFNIGLQCLHIDRLYAIIGGSVGGGIAWEMAVRYPKLADYIVPVATDWKATDWLIANCLVQDAILNNSSQPLQDARMHAMTLYRTPESLTAKFNRTKHNTQLFNIESWLLHHGDRLQQRFQLSAYKMMNQILKTIDVTQNGKYSFVELASSVKSTIVIVTITSDLFFKPQEHWATYVDLKPVKPNVIIGEINSIHGHDAFLIEYEQLQDILKPMFSKQYKLDERVIA